MKTNYEIVKSIIARRDEYDAMLAARRGKTYRALALGGGAAAACLVGLAVLSSVLRHVGGRQIVENLTPVPVTNAPLTAAPTDAPVTAVPTDAPQTPVPTQHPERFVFFSSHKEYLASARALIAGEAADGVFSYNNGGVFFGLEDDALVAYERAYYSPDDAEQSFELLDPIAYFPRELGERAVRSVADNIRRYKQPDFADDENLQLYGFMGEGYIIFTDEPFHGYQASAIFALDENGEWTEFKGNEACSQQLTGGCILPGGVGILSYFDREGMRLDDYTPRELLVYRTENYGESWEKLTVCIPEEYESMIAPPSCALTPVFDGEHGVMMASFVSFEGEDMDAVTHTVWFESTDGGASWRFMGEVGEGSPA